jgi:hypothetical protein
MEEISWPFGFVFQAEVFTMLHDGTDLNRLTHDAGENANVFVGPHSLPKELSDEGAPLACEYRDSPMPTAPSSCKKENKANPFARCFPWVHGPRADPKKRGPIGMPVRSSVRPL